MLTLWNCWKNENLLLNTFINKQWYIFEGFAKISEFPFFLRWQALNEWNEFTLMRFFIIRNFLPTAGTKREVVVLKKGTLNYWKYMTVWCPITHILQTTKSKLPGPWLLQGGELPQWPKYCRHLLAYLWCPLSD